MKVAYWPGCVSRGFTPELHGSMAKVAPLLDIELVELDRACCSGAGVIAEHNQELADTLNARTFALAQQVEGAAMMMNICSTCQGAQSECQERLDASAEYREQVNSTLAGEGLNYEKGLTNKNFLWLLVEEIGLENLRERVRRPLSNLKVGPFYGCYIVRPRNRLGIDEEHPRDHYLHHVIEALGGTVIDYAGMRKCCGFPIITMNKEASLKQAGRHLGDAMDAEADCLVTPCPLCHLNLDLQQPLASRRGRTRSGHASPASAPARRPRPRAGAQGAGHGQARRAPDLGDRLVDLGGRRGGVGREAVRILTVVGNRPQFIKAAAVSGLLRERNEEILVHTGQHYDDALSRIFFNELGLARPDRELGIGGASNTSQTARMLGALEPLIAELGPDAALVYGDTNSTLAGALAAAQGGVPVVHVEAGMRSFDRSMPEELNRVLADHLGELLLCASDTAAENLRAESVSGRVEVVGDVMVDVALRWQPAARGDVDVPAAHGLRPGEYLLLTAHRAGNVDDPDRLRALLELIEALPDPVLFPLHPRTRARLASAGLLEQLGRLDGVTVTEPLGYVEFSALLCQARTVLTDSGGVQKEAYLAGVPCLTLRANTEWVETVQTGWNTLVDLDAATALAALERRPPAERPPLYGDGHAAERCVAAIEAL